MGVFTRSDSKHSLTASFVPVLCGNYFNGERGLMIVAVVFVQTRNALAQPRSFPALAAIVLQGERGLIIVAVFLVQTRNALAQPRSFPSLAANCFTRGARLDDCRCFLRSDLKRSCAVTFVPALLRIFEMFLNQRMRIFCLRRRFYVSRLPKNDKKYIRILDYLRAVL